MIEQYTITTTPKYNFPQPTIDTALPQRFLEQSLHSLKQVQPHQPFQLNQQPFQQLSTAEQYPSTLQLNRTPIPLKPNHQETTIAAVDTSTIKIGETATGIIIAIRGATTWKQNRTYRYTRLGPFIFHITEENKHEVYNTLEHAYFTTQYGNSHQAPNLIQIPMRLASLLERWLQTMLAKTITNGLLLLDGSLTSGTIDTPAQRMKEILTLARKNHSTVLAFSKMTTLRVNGYLITDQLPNNEPPYLLETNGLRFKPPTILLGDVYVARLNKANYAFRLDIDREIPFPQRLEAVEKIVGNDLYTQGYPETLRLSHILCTFTANEVLAMKHFITRKHGIQIINRPDMHRLLFGPFGRGEIYS
jgi:hypothetical protein